jgi:sn-glycerol 3-phosphate transport system substrate-binding protein
MAAYKTPDMIEFLNKNSDAKIAVEQLEVAKPWFATYKTVPVRKTLEDEVMSVLNGKKQPKEALVAAQKAADELLKPYNDETALQLP